MRIGIDFDNTIANYEGVFHAVAMERGLIGADTPKGKNAVRDFLNKCGRNDDFTALQGYVYGSRMDMARPYQGFREFTAAARAARHDIFIVSHKTRFPMLGPTYDMHEAARAFLHDHKLVGSDAVPLDRIFFEQTKELKIDRAVALDVDVFIDDLPEIFAMPGLSNCCRRILFAPNGATPSIHYEVCRSWHEITALLLGPPR
jgi:hypothetical protein